MDAYANRLIYSFPPQADYSDPSQHRPSFLPPAIRTSSGFSPFPPALLSRWVMNPNEEAEERNRERSIFSLLFCGEREMQKKHLCAYFSFIFFISCHLFSLGSSSSSSFEHSRSGKYPPPPWEGEFSSCCKSFSGRGGGKRVGGVFPNMGILNKVTFTIPPCYSNLPPFSIYTMRAIYLSLPRHLRLPIHHPRCFPRNSEREKRIKLSFEYLNSFSVRGITCTCF